MKQITASEGMTLTNGEAFGKTVYLAVEDDPGAWWQITDEQALQLRQQQRQAALAELEVFL